MSEVVVVGNVGIDTNVYLPQDFRPTDMLEREAAFTTNRDGVGQAGGYSSIGYARLGRDVGFLGYVGDDPMGRWIDEVLTTAGVQTHLMLDPTGTSRSINLVASDGHRNNFYDGKDHMRLVPDESRCRAALGSARLVHVHLPNWARRVLPWAKEEGAIIATDLQDVLDPDDPYRRDFIMASDVLFASTVDAASPKGLAEALLDRNPDAILVLGMGAEGAALASSKVGFQVVPPVPHPSPVVDTNGAGDSLAVGFLTAYVLEGRPPAEALLWGLVAARHACTLPADRSHELIRPDELKRRITELAHG